MNTQLREQLEKSHYLHKGMLPDLANAAETRWLAKPVLATREIPLTEQLEQMKLVGPGWIDVNTLHSREKISSVRVEHQTVRPVQSSRGRAYTTTELFVPIQHEDWSAYNRLCVWILVEAQGGANNHITLSIHNDGPKINPVPGRFDGWTAPTLPTGKWTRVVWEFPDIGRNDVTAVSFCMHASGTPYPGEPKVCYFINDLRVETVDTDKDKGFDLRKDAIAYCHSGYRMSLPKQAMVQHHRGAFTLRDEQQKDVFVGKSIALKDGFSLLDFSEFAQEGIYTLHMGDLCTKSFPIGREAYLSAAWKTLNYFFVARCGFSVPHVHAQCHLDVVSVHPDGRKQCVAGGWHDAGDLTQDGRNTMECALAMLELFEAAKQKEPALSARSLEEARWGLDWLMRTRWGDGYRHCGRIISVWTDNILGGTDDIQTTAEIRPYDNLLVAQVFAKAAMALCDEDPAYASLCGRYAKEDFRFGIEWMYRAPTQSFSFATQLQLNAQAALTAIELYKTFGESEHLNYAARFARVVMRCQQKTVSPKFKLPLRGYFFETESCEREQSYFHRSYEQVPIQALSALVLTAPMHPDAQAWHESLELYAEYLKLLADVTPYGVMASSVYRLDAADFSNIYHEGNQSVGAPSMEEYNAQVKNGIQLDDTHYLRIFPVSYQFRGFHAPLMGKALAAMEIDKALGDTRLRQIAARQLEWMLGYNPFAVSGVYGEGYDYHPLYTGLLPQIVGAVPVGFETFEDEDIPYYPMQNLPTYKEIWVHTTCRLMKSIAYLGLNE